jgi:hypothetical protein
MATEDHLSSVMGASASPLSRARGVTLQWDGRRGVCRGVELHPFSVPRRPSAFQAKRPPAPGHRARPSRARLGSLRATDAVFLPLACPYLWMHMPR